MCASTPSTSEFNTAETSFDAVFQLSICAQDSNLISFFCAVRHNLETVAHLYSLDVVHQNLELVLSVTWRAPYAAQDLNHRLRSLVDVDAPQKLDEGLLEESVALHPVVFLENFVAAHLKSRFLALRHAIKTHSLGDGLERELGEQDKQQHVVVVVRYKLSRSVEVPHEAPHVLVQDPEIFLVLRNLLIPLFDLEADVLAEATKKGLEKSVAFDSELNKIVYLVSCVARDHKGY